VLQLIHQRGTHNISAGVDGRMHRIDFFNSAQPSGLFAFAQQQTRADNVVTTGGNAYAAFLLGFGSSGSITNASGSELEDFYGAV
jgi:hypothetical protein